MPHLLTLKDLSLETIDEILTRAEYLQAHSLETKASESTFAVNMFFEPSTRTKLSFEVAEKRLGLNVLNFDETNSSTQKGETLYDTLRVLEEIGVKAAVIRHSDKGFYQSLQDRLSLSIINAGDGSGHHPSQTLLDLLTIKQEFGRLNGLTIAMIGDLRYSRVARSNAEVFARLGARIILSGPPEWQAEDFPGTYVSIEEAIQSADVVNLLRIQKERHEDAAFLSKADYHKAYGLTIEREQAMKANAIIMHPAPFNRGVEIADELVEGKRSRIFKQMHNGVPIRMAILEWALGLSAKPIYEEMYA